MIVLVGRSSGVVGVSAVASRLVKFTVTIGRGLAAIGVAGAGC